MLAVAVALHDCVHIEKSDPRRSQASRLAGEKASGILLAEGWTQARIDLVVHAIEAHSYSAGIEAKTPEAKILQDADRLDAIGAIGIARLFSVTGRLGRAFYDRDDFQAERRPYDERRWSIDHIFTKLLGLETTMQTEEGRRLAVERTNYLREFLARMRDEAGV